MSGKSSKEVNEKSSEKSSEKRSEKAGKKEAEEPQLSGEQSAVLSTVKSGKNVFFTGSAGTGKSYLLKTIISYLEPQTTAVTASTGLAASAIGGVTLHHFAGVGLAQDSVEKCVEYALRNPKTKARWKKTKTLIVDELSMISGELWDKFNIIGQNVREDFTRPFGGIQLILTADFLQLAPVEKDAQKVSFCFEAKCWAECASTTMVLTKIFRQKENDDLRRVLEPIRRGFCDQTAIDLLQQCCKPLPISEQGIEATVLMPQRKKVDYENTKRLEALIDQEEVFIAKDTGRHRYKLDTECIAPRILKLKLKAQVLLIKNLTPSLVNGSRGVVVGFEGKEKNPKVKFLNGEEKVICAEAWHMELNGVKQATRIQIPLLLAWALTIHKAQGMTLDYAKMALARCFANGQAYVALSRVRGLNCLELVDFSTDAVFADPRALDFMDSLLEKNQVEKTEENPSKKRKQ